MENCNIRTEGKASTIDTSFNGCREIVNSKHESAFLIISGNMAMKPMRTPEHVLLGTLVLAYLI
jgi:hypothetical protein